MLRVDPGTERSRKTKDPCPACALHRRLCICAQMPRLDLRSRLTLVVHAKELKRTTNTGRLAARALVNSEVVVRGQGPVDLAAKLCPGYRPLLLFPGEGARDLSADLLGESTLPIQLIVPDGNWRQASKVASRHPEISGVERVMIKAPNLARHHLRAESSSEGMSTLQAIAKAFGIIEGAEVGAALEAFYQAKLSATLIGRGIIRS